VAALLLVAVFFLGITPKIFLHDSFATHKDLGVNCKEKSGAVHFHAAGITCDCDNFVIDAPFCAIQFDIAYLHQTLCSIKQTAHHSSCPSLSFALASLRAPPVSIV
jgi:hypothetical protein